MNMDPVCISLVHQYLESTSPALADQFKTKYQPKETNVRLDEVLSKWNEEQLARNIVHQHLTIVSPSLALEFRNTKQCTLENVPRQLMEFAKESQQTQPEKTSVTLGEKFSRRMKRR